MAAADDDARKRLNELDNAAVAAVEAGDEAASTTPSTALLAFVRADGTRSADDDLRAVRRDPPARRPLASPRPARTSPARA